MKRLCWMLVPLAVLFAAVGLLSAPAGAVEQGGGGPPCAGQATFTPHVTQGYIEGTAAIYCGDSHATIVGDVCLERKLPLNGTWGPVAGGCSDEIETDVGAQTNVIRVACESPSTFATTYRVHAVWWVQLSNGTVLDPDVDAKSLEEAVLCSTTPG